MDIGTGIILRADTDCLKNLRSSNHRRSICEPKVIGARLHRCSPRTCNGGHECSDMSCLGDSNLRQPVDIFLCQAQCKEVSGREFGESFFVECRFEVLEGQRTAGD